MKHVWILNHYAQTPTGSGATRHYYFAKNLEAYGWTASIIAASVEMHTKEQRLSKMQLKRLEVINGVPFLWLKTPSYTRNNWRRMLNMLAFGVHAIIPFATKYLVRPDAIIGSSVHPFAALAGAIIAWRRHVPFLFEVRDLWPQTLIDMGYLRPESFVTNIFQHLELWLYKRASTIIAVLPQAYEYIVPLGIAREKIIWIPNGVDMQAFPQPRPPTPNPAVFTLMYFGAHGRANGIENTLEAMACLNKLALPLPIKLRLIGDGPDKSQLIEKAKTLGLTNVSFEPPVPKSKIPTLAQEADAFVFNILNLPLYRFGISLNKLFDYMASGRPIIYAGSASNDPVAEAQAGLTVPPENPQAMAEAIVQLMAMSPELREEMGGRGRRYVEEKHSFAYLSQKLATALDVCTANARE